MKAVEAAISSRQWNKAIQILEVVQDPAVAGKYYKKIAQHYANMGDYEVALECLNGKLWLKSSMWFGIAVGVKV